MQRIFTERAHLMCPNMCFGIAMAVDRPYDEAAIRDTVKRMSSAHPFLNALLGYDEAENVYYYHVTDRPQVELRLKGGGLDAIYRPQAELRLKGGGIDATYRPQAELRLKGGGHDATDSESAAYVCAAPDSPELMEEYRRLTGRDWNLFEEGMLKISAWQAGTMTQFLLVFHHLLADGRGALGLAEELAECYVYGLEPKAAPETLISSSKDFPSDSRLPLISRMLVGRANKAWAKERHQVTYDDYHAFANEFLQGDVVRHSIYRTGQDELDRIRKKCHKAQVTVNDYLIAKMMLEENTRKVIIASDLRNRLSCYKEGALGNYSTAFSVELHKKAVTEYGMGKAASKRGMGKAVAELGTGKAQKSVPDTIAERSLFSLARVVHDRVAVTMARPADLYLVLQCYADLDPGLLDAAFISCKGGFQSKAGKFIGSLFFGFEAGNGYSITNLGATESESIADAYFIPPASPAIHKTQGILTVNGVMTVCTSER